MDPDTTAECAQSYPDLRRAQFEENYLRFHAELPVIVQADTAETVQHAPASSCRFLHVDASHQYRNTRTDVATARKLLVADGIVVFDDFRSIHTPGVAAAVWEAVVADGLCPVAVTPFKLYGTWGDPPGRRSRSCGAGSTSTPGTRPSRMTSPGTHWSG